MSIDPKNMEKIQNAESISRQNSKSPESIATLT